MKLVGTVKVCILPCGCGGTGRHAAFRALWRQLRGGSNPLIRTTMTVNTEDSSAVPFYSQYRDVTQPEWQSRACGITALKMLLDFWHARTTQNKTVSLDELLGSKKVTEAFMQNVGWSHKGLVSIAQDHSYEGFNKDLVAMKATAKQAFAQLKKDSAYFPIMASVWNKFDPAKGGGHLVVVTGIKDGKVFINNPEAKNNTDGIRTMSEAEFITGFKKRYIAVYPKHFLSRLDKMKIFNVDILLSYLAMIHNSPGTKMFRNFYARMPAGSADVLQNGNLSCAVFVSSVLYQWGLINDTHATVRSTVADMLGSGWYIVKKPRIGSIVEWEPKKIKGGTNTHIGFYIDKNEAVSNNPEKQVPWRHHWTYGINTDGTPKRAVTAIYWHPSLEK